MEAVLEPVSNLLRLNDQLYERALDGVTNELARRPLDGGNRLLWIAAHMVVPRAGLVNRLGGASACSGLLARDRQSRGVACDPVGRPRRS
jgi:hypothetical protein